MAGVGLLVNIDGRIPLASKNVALHILHSDLMIAGNQFFKEGAGRTDAALRGHGSAIRGGKGDGSAGDKVFIPVELTVCVHIEKKIDEQGIRCDVLANDRNRFGKYLRLLRLRRSLCT